MAPPGNSTVSPSRARIGPQDFVRPSSVMTGIGVAVRATGTGAQRFFFFALNDFIIFSTVSRIALLL